MKLRFPLILLLLLAVVYACNEEDLTQLDPNRVTPENYYNTEAELEAAVLGVYGPLRATFVGGRWYFNLTDYADDHHEPTPDAAFFGIIANGQQTAALTQLGQYWDGLYTLIHRANTALDGIAANTTVDEDIKEALAAEAYFLRGWAYNEIATTWGGAPIYTTRVRGFDDLKGRSTREEVFAQAQADLQIAADDLPLEWADQWKGRATRGAALGMLGRSYMQTQDLAAARTALEAVVDLGLYSLNENWYDSFAEENDFTPEALFEIPYGNVQGFNWASPLTGEINPTNVRTMSVRPQVYGPTWRNSYPSGELLNLFETEEQGDPVTDPRLRLTAIFQGDVYNGGQDTLTEIKSNGSAVDFHGEEVLVNFYKHNVYYKTRPFRFNQRATNTVLMRLADVYLLLAEIEARQGNPEEARDYVNLVRNRVGLPDLEDSMIPNDSDDELMAAIIRERSVELASEQVRWRDIRRWDEAGIIDAADVLPYWTDDQFLWPIPNGEIENNPNISPDDQNPGYN